MRKKVLVTGAAGFIGFHISKLLCSEGWEVVGIDNLNDYYDVNLKNNRLAQLDKFINFRFELMDLSSKNELYTLFRKEDFKYVINLAAQAGVRYSLINPRAYIDSNIVGFLNLLECCRRFRVEHLVYASSSSVYGNNKKIPYSEEDRVDNPISLYAATKKSNELMSYTYSHLFNIPATGLRFFTVYGPWGRPDMAYFSFTKSILEGKPINVYNHGKMRRDFTYIDDITRSIILLLEKPPLEIPGKGIVPNNIFNIGNNKPEDLLKFINIIEEALGIKAEKIMLPMQPGDVPETYADIKNLNEYIGFSPSTTIEEGINKFVDWYKSYFQPEYSRLSNSVN